MLNIINIHTILKNEFLQKTNILNYKDIFVLQRGNVLDSPPRSYLSIEKFNIVNKKIETFKFSKIANFVSDTNFYSTALYIHSKQFSEIIYYGHLNNEFDEYSIDLYKLNCTSWTQDSFLSINIGIKNNNVEYLPLVLETQLVAIDERYCLIFIPNTPGKTKYTGIFEKAMLIDFLEKKHYELQMNIKNLNFINLLDEVLVVNDGKNIVFKTLRIDSTEKRNIYNKEIKKKSDVQGYAFLETLIVVETNKFVHNIKNQKSETDYILIDSIDLKGALNIIHIDDTKIIYYIESFKNNSTTVKTYTFNNSKRTCIELAKSYDNIKFFNNNLYQISSNYLEESFEAYHINEQKLLIKSKEFIVYVNDTIFITETSNKKKFGSSILKIYDLNNKLINTLQCRSYYFCYEKDMLILI